MATSQSTNVRMGRRAAAAQDDLVCGPVTDFPLSEVERKWTWWSVVSDRLSAVRRALGGA